MRPCPGGQVKPHRVWRGHFDNRATRLKALLQAAVPQPQGAALRLRQLRTPWPRRRTEVDVVVSGGGLKGYFLLGARHAIAKRPDLVVTRYSGTSAGAWTAMFMATGLSSADWLATYTLTAEAARRAAAPWGHRLFPARLPSYRGRAVRGGALRLQQ